jgi:hypothetical protein
VVAVIAVVVVGTVANSLLEDRVFTFTPDRSHSPNPKPAEVPDLYSIGSNLIASGKVIDRYVEKRRRGLVDALDREDGPDPDELELDGLDKGEDDRDVMNEMLEGLL